VHGGDAPAPSLLVHGVEDSRADGHVQHRHRLVSCQELRLQDERSRQHGALQLPAGQLVPIAIEEHLVGPQVNVIERSPDSLLALRRIADVVDQQWLDHRAQDGEAWAERLIRILEHELRPGAIALQS